MLALLSPAKKLDFSEYPMNLKFSTPALMEDTEALVGEARQLLASDLEKLMGISSKLAALNVARFRHFSTPFTQENSKPAIWAFSGDTYVGFDAKTLSDAEIKYADKSVGILSGLYGLLKPLDLIQAYRLEMGTRFKNSRGKDLYSFWDDRISKQINQQLKGHKHKVIVNCASNEYFKSVQDKALKADIVTPVFKETKGEKLKVVGIFAKRARGLMARFMVKNRIEEPEGIRGFNEGGYTFRPDLSNEQDWIFVR
ncbi:MAG: peroxide stress protein YaaA [Myxococcota bacterium]|nr:peroxide stress protein YaaA [Myxococcota bacterium]